MENAKNKTTATWKTFIEKSERHGGAVLGLGIVYMLASGSTRALYKLSIMGVGLVGAFTLFLNLTNKEPVRQFDPDHDCSLMNRFMTWILLLSIIPLVLYFWVQSDLFKEGSGDDTTNVRQPTIDVLSWFLAAYTALYGVACLYNIYGVWKEYSSGSDTHYHQDVENYIMPLPMVVLLLANQYNHIGKSFTVTNPFKSQSG